MTTWHWIRHGPTHEKSIVGWRDVPADLSDTVQIARLNAYLPDNAVLISSDLIRASATADALAHPTRTRLPHSADFREIDFGLWDGLHSKEVKARDPELSSAFWANPGDTAAPEGESWNDTAARVRRSVDALNLRYPDSHIIAVAHFGVILTQVQRALAVSGKEVLAHKIDNLSVTRIHASEQKWHTAQINHLP